MDFVYPLRISDGDLAIGEPTDTQQALSVLLTIKGERPLQPSYGSEPYLFANSVELGYDSTLAVGTLIVNQLISSDTL